MPHKCPKTWGIKKSWEIWYNKGRGMKFFKRSKKKTNKKIASSSILGIISIILSFGAFIILGSFSSRTVARDISGTLFLLIILCYAAILSIVIFGLIKGIKGLKLPKKKSAIIGIILCSIGFVLTVILGLWNMIILLASIT